jgi:hypothetical protein
MVQTAAMDKPRRRLGWLGPAIIIVGAAVAVVGAWYMHHAQPRAGAIVDTVQVASDAEVVIRDEDGGPHSFLELHRDGKVVWEAFIPKYAGRPGAPGIAYSPNAVSVRVSRDGHAEVFALSTHDASKLGGFTLAVEHEPIETQPTGPVTLTDNARSYELVGGRDWHQLIAVDLTSGKGIWKADLGPPPITGGHVDAHAVTIEQGTATKSFDRLTGAAR